MGNCIEKRSGGTQNSADEIANTLQVDLSWIDDFQDGAALSKIPEVASKYS